MPKKMRVAIIDEEPLFRAGVKQVLSQEEDIEVLEASPEAELLDFLESSYPDVVLLGISLSSQDGLELGRKIARAYPMSRVVILSPNPGDEDLFEVIKSSAVACLGRGSSGEDLIRTVRRASRGEYPINDSVVSRPALAQKVLSSFKDTETSDPSRAVLVSLTGREREILSLVADGFSNRDIARRLGISEQTIKNHVSAILRKLNANDRAHAVVLAVRRGLISL